MKTKISLNASEEALQAHNERLTESLQETAEFRKEELMLVFGQLGHWELLVTSLLHGLNPYGIYMSVTEIARFVGRPRTAIEDFRKSAVRKIGSAVARTLLEDATGYKLVPMAVALKSRKDHTEVIKNLRAA